MDGKYITHESDMYEMWGITIIPLVYLDSPWLNSLPKALASDQQYEAATSAKKCICRVILN